MTSAFVLIFVSSFKYTRGRRGCVRMHVCPSTHTHKAAPYLAALIFIHFFIYLLTYLLIYFGRGERERERD